MGTHWEMWQDGDREPFWPEWNDLLPDQSEASERRDGRVDVVWWRMWLNDWRRLTYLYTATTVTLTFNTEFQEPAINGTKSMTQLRSVTRHMGSHSVTFHPTQVNTPNLHSSHTGWYSIYRPFKGGGLSKPRPRVLCKEQLAHGCYATARSQRGLNPWPSDC